jgi:hypothetical protein
MGTAFTLMQKNRDFIVEQTQLYIANAYPDFQYNVTVCNRDVGLIVDAISYDVYWGGYDRAIASGQAYWNGATNVVSGEITQTTAAIDFIGVLANGIVQNSNVTIYSPYTINQYFGTGTAGAISTNRISQDVGIINNIIQYGPSERAASQGFTNARTLLQKNKTFLAQQVNGYIYSAEFSTLHPGWTISTANAAICMRDVGYIVDCVSADVITGGRSESIAAGTAYYNGVTPYIPVGDIPPTVTAVTYLANIANLVIQNISVPTWPSVSAVQYKDSGNLILGNQASTLVVTNIDTIADIIGNGVNAANVDIGIANASVTLNSNKNFLQAQTSQWVNDNYPDFQYDIEKCIRDVGYIVDAVVNDLNVGGVITNSIQAGRAYWDGTQTLIPQQESQTTGAIAYVKSMALNVINNVTVNVTQPFVSQTFTVSLGGADAAQATGYAFDTVINMINTGAYSQTLTAKGYVDASLLIEDNVDWFKSKVNAYINSAGFTSAYPGVITPSIANTCQRDTGYILAALSTDLITGSDEQSQQAGLAYWTGVTSVLPTPQKAPTVNTLTWLTTLVVDVIQNTVVSDAYPVATPQQTNFLLNQGNIAVDAVQDNMALLIDIVNTGGANQRPLYIGSGSTRISSIEETIYDNQAAWILRFAEPLGGNYWGPAEFTSYPGPLIFVQPDSLLPYQGQGLNSMVLDAYTQYNQICKQGLSGGGKGIVIKNGGYAQLVSIFEICCNIGVLAESGGYCSITNSNTDFGWYGLWADGLSDLQYTTSLQTFDALTNNMTIAGLPEYPVGSGKYKRPYVGQVVTISKYLPAEGAIVAGEYDEFYILTRIEVTYGGQGYTSIPNVLFQDPSSVTGGVRAQAVANVAGGVVVSIDLLVSGSMFTADQLADPGFISIVGGGATQTATARALAEIIYYDLLTSTDPVSGAAIITLDQRLTFTPDTLANPSPAGLSKLRFYQVSRVISSSHCLEYVGSGVDIAKCIPARGGVPDQAREVIMTLGGRVAYTSTDHLGNFRIGPELVINQNTGTLSGRTFQKSLFAIMTPYILALE